MQVSVNKAPCSSGTHPGVSTLHPVLRAPYRPGLHRGDPVTPAIQDVPSQRLTCVYSFFLTKRKTMKVVQKYSMLLQNNQKLWNF